MTHSGRSIAFGKTEKMLRFCTCLALLVSFSGDAFASESSITTCEVRLIEYVEDSLYSEELDGEYLDFLAPEATFAVISPSKFEGRRIRVIFLSSKHVGVLAELGNGIGDGFTLKVPTEYFGYPDSVVIKSYLIGIISRTD
jgi:hypothetical protein